MSLLTWLEAIHQIPAREMECSWENGMILLNGFLSPSPACWLNHCHSKRELTVIYQALSDLCHLPSPLSQLFSCISYHYFSTADQAFWTSYLSSDVTRYAHTPGPLHLLILISLPGTFIPSDMGTVHFLTSFNSFCICHLSAGPSWPSCLKSQSPYLLLLIILLFWVSWFFCYR